MAVENKDQDKQQSNANEPPWRLYLAIILIVIGAVSAISWGYAEVSFLAVNPNLSDEGSDIFLKYLFIVVAVERAAAVFVNNYRNRKVADWTLRVSRIKETLTNEEQHVKVLAMVFEREIKVAKKVLDKGMFDLLTKPEDSPDEYRAALLCLRSRIRPGEA